jgi:monoamine oxidase
MIAPGSRTWSLYGGDTYTELGGFTQNIRFDKDQYLNPGPWRIPYHHDALLHYCRLLNVALEPFVQINYKWVGRCNAANSKRTDLRPKLRPSRSGRRLRGL